jgi:hypothetical protein
VPGREFWSKRPKSLRNYAGAVLSQTILMIANIGTAKSPHIQYRKISDKITATGLTFFTSRSGSLLGTALRVTGAPGFDIGCAAVQFRNSGISELCHPSVGSTPSLGPPRAGYIRPATSKTITMISNSPNPPVG